MIRKSIRERAIAAWPPAWHGRNLRDMLITLGYDVDRPWRELPKKDRDWILFTDEQPVVPVYIGYDADEARAGDQTQGGAQLPRQFLQRQAICAEHLCHHGKRRRSRSGYRATW